MSHATRGVHSRLPSRSGGPSRAFHLAWHRPLILGFAVSSVLFAALPACASVARADTVQPAQPVKTVPTSASSASSASSAASVADSSGLVDENAPEPAIADHDVAGSETGRAADASPLFQQAASILAGRHEGVDTAALLTAIQEKARWGELPDRLLEAQGILLCNRGDTRMGLACLRRVARPGPHANFLLGEGALRKGDRYEAAALFLKSARAYPEGDARAADAYRGYLEIKPADAAVEAELADRLEKLGRYGEAARLRAKDPDRAASDPAAALRIGAMLTGLGHWKEAQALYRKAIARHPSDKALRLGLAAACEGDGLRLEAGQAYAEAWAADPGDTALRDRAIAHFEAAGAAARAPLRGLLEKAVAADGADHRIRFRLAVALLADGDRASAYPHLAEALKSSPGDPAYQARLPEVIEGDSLIEAHSAFLRSEFEHKGGSVRLVELAARAYTLSGHPTEACRAWYQLFTMAPQALEGRRDAAVSLGSCGDPAYLSVAGRLAAPMAERHPGDKEINLIVLRAQVQDGQYEQASLQARRLFKAFPEEAGEALASAKAMLSMEKPGPAKEVLMDLSRSASGPEVSLLLGGILHGEKDCPAAVDHLEASADTFPVAYWLLGECMESLNEPLRAAFAFQAYFSRTGDKESLVALARATRAAGDPSREKEALESLVAKGWAGEADRLRLARVHLDLGDSAKAEALGAELFKSRMSIPAEAAWVDAGIFLGARLAGQGRHDKAIRPLSLALSADASRAEGWKLLGDCQATLRQWKAAVASYAGAEASGGAGLDLARAQLEAALKLDSRRDIARAHAGILRADPSREESNDYLARYHQAERNYLDAAHHFRNRLKAHPEDARAWESLGNCLALVPDLPAAGEALQKALDLGIESDEVYVNRARAYRHEGARDMAASIMDFLLGRNPRSYLGLVWSAKFAEEDGNPNLAMELFKKAARLNPPKTLWPELASQGVTSASAETSPLAR